eukprot:TRINITY_DN55063_c0_g1_i1.p1 TRINITY_DN55063_c0_g1~~TRINITY_DN55063_c0_g1_i1.p1  ORF type:complete len:425 (+),score=99.92 TRINITY_DN55063_c0_g1_i1:85-1359(+)
MGAQLTVSAGGVGRSPELLPARGGDVVSPEALTARCASAASVPPLRGLHADETSPRALTSVELREVRCFVLPMCCVVYFASSSGLTLFNKYFLSDSNFGFKFPLTVTALNQGVMALMLWPRESRGALLRSCFGPPCRLHEDPQRKSVVHQVLASGALAGVDWGLSNVSIGFVSVSLYEFVKAATPIFICAFSFALGVTAPNLPLLCSMTLLSIGAAMSVWGTHEADVHAAATSEDAVAAMDPFGTVCILLAMMCAGLRLVLLQRAMQTAQTPLPPSSTMPYLALASFLALILPAQVIEGPRLLHHLAEQGAEYTARAALLAMVSTTLAVLLTVTEIFVIALSSAFTFAALGMLKQMAIVALAKLIYKDRLTTMVLAGYGVTLSGVAWYRRIKLTAPVSTQPLTDDTPAEPAEPLSGHRSVQAPS